MPDQDERELKLIRHAEEAVGTDDHDARDQAGADGPPTLLDRKRILQTTAIVLVLIAAIYFLLPNLIGVEDAVGRLKQADPLWVGVALVFCVLMFFSYVALFRGVVGENVPHVHWKESYQITMAGLAATRLFAAGGAGGIVLTYWALRKAGMPRRIAAARMVAFLVLLYSIYMATLIVVGLLLYFEVLSGSTSVGLTLVPSAIAAAVIVVFLLMAMIPADFDKRMGRFGKGRRTQAIAGRIAKAPTAIAGGTRIALGFFREPRRGGLALLGASGFWASQVGILWASFHAFDVSVPLGVIIQGFFIGMVANLFPFAPGGVGAVDAGMIGTFALFGISGSVVFPAVLMYRFIAFWLPIPPGFVAFIQLRRTVGKWEEKGYEAEADREEKAGAHEADWGETDATAAAGAESGTK